MAEGEVLGLIGPNGAGKTTVFNLLSGFLRPDAGDIRFRGGSLLGQSPHAICRRGLARTFQIVRPFPRLSVLDNVLVGALARHPAAPRARELARAVVERVGLGAKAAQPAAGLTLAERKRLELARALATEPALLLLDEVMAGLNQTEIATLVALVGDIHRGGVSILLIEHNMRAVMTLSHRIVVLNFGEQVAEGPPDAIANHPRVIEAYLGEEYLHAASPRWRRGGLPRPRGGARGRAGGAPGRGGRAHARHGRRAARGPGGAPVAWRLISASLKAINEPATTILLVEQNVARALALSHRAYVIENGRIVLDGPREALQQSQHVKQAYLGL